MSFPKQAVQFFFQMKIRVIVIIIIIIIDGMVILKINNREGLSVTASFSGLKRENKNHSSDMEKV